ncbi:MAG: FAD-dependent monooxygenase, partial [Rhodospirillaceae bacterium]|nr:FAD-dependent monooxygenase [Rhodospirillaceae bacterium]
MTKPPPAPPGLIVGPAADRTAIRADVAIVGAGLVGGTLACALSRFGIKTAVIDRVNPAAMVATTFDGRASAVALSARRMLDAIGLWDHVAASEPIREIRVSDGPSPFFLHYDHADLGRDFLGFMAENRHLRMAIAATMENVKARMSDTLTIISPASVADMTQTADSITLTLDDGRTVTAQLAVSAEGRGAKL